MALAGYATTVKIPGDAVAMSEEEFDGTTDPLVWELGSGAPLDPSTAVSVLDGVTPVDAADYTVDYLFGRITFEEELSGPVYVTGAYLPLLTVGEVRSTSLSLSWAELDSTSSDSAGYAQVVQGMKTGEASLSGLRLLEETIDVAGDLPTWAELHNDATPKLLEVGLGSRKWRGWVRFPGLGQEAPADGLVTSNITAKTITRPATGRSEVVTYGFGE